MAIGGEKSVETVDLVGEAAAKAVADQKGCKLVRFVLSGAGAGAFAYDLVYDDASKDNDLLARNKSTILRSLIAQLGEHKLTLARASDQPPAPLPF
jgi:predicted nucleotidyltransferase